MRARNANHQPSTIIKEKDTLSGIQKEGASRRKQIPQTGSHRPPDTPTPSTKPNGNTTAPKPRPNASETGTAARVTYSPMTKPHGGPGAETTPESPTQRRRRPRKAERTLTSERWRNMTDDERRVYVPGYVSRADPRYALKSRQARLWCP